MEKPKLLVILFSIMIMALFSWTSHGADYEVHIVEKGDTLYSLAKACGMSVNELIALNGLTGSDIRIGDMLKIPGKEMAESGHAETGSDLSVGTVSLAIALPPPESGSRPPAVADEVVQAVSSRNDSQAPQITKEEYELLARLVHAESRGEPLEGQVAVAAVVLNRVEHPSFPNSVKEVILEPGQFLSVNNGMIDLIPNDDCRRAVEMALQGQDPSGGALFFYNPRKSKALAWWSTRTTTAVIGDHNFAI